MPTWRGIARIKLHGKYKVLSMTPGDLEALEEQDSAVIDMSLIWDKIAD